MKKWLTILLLLCMVISLVACSASKDTVEMSTYGGNSIIKMYTEGGNLMAVHYYNQDTKITTIYRYNYTYDQTFCCTHVDIVVLSDDGNEVYSSVSSPSEVNYNG